MSSALTMRAVFARCTSSTTTTTAAVAASFSVAPTTMRSLSSSSSSSFFSSSSSTSPFLSQHHHRHHHHRHQHHRLDRLQRQRRAYKFNQFDSTGDTGITIGKYKYPRDDVRDHFDRPYRPEEHMDGVTDAASVKKNKQSATDKLLSTPGSVAAPDSPTRPVSYVDTCMHLDQAFSRLPPEETYESLRSHFPTHFDSLVNVTLRPNMFPASIELAENNEDVYNMFGVHPFYSDGYTDKLGDQLKTDFLSHPKTVACGVIGLDFSSRFSPAVIELQKKAFTYQLNYAVIAKKPVAVYNRFADADTLRILKKELPASWPLVLCNYMGSPRFLSDIWSHFSFAFVGVNGVVTHNTTTGRVLQDIVRKAPLDRLLLESNGPYMIPDPHRDQGHICHSGYVPMVAQKIADLKGINVIEVYRQCRINTREAYGIEEKAEPATAV